MLWHLGLVLSVATFTIAQLDVAACTDVTYNWSFNSRQQSPCVVSSYLGGVCTLSNFRIPTLHGEEAHYLGPAVGNGNPCRCSSVFYSMISACALCQSKKYLKWSAYGENCSIVYSGVFTPNIPGGTAVPHYAYLDVVIADQFNPIAAQLVVDAPESTGIAPSTAFATPTNPPSHSKSSKAGPIAGGVVGGIAALALIAVGAFWLFRRHRAGITQTATMISTSQGAPTPNNGAINASTYTMVQPLTPPRLYDPSDPSTYPFTPATSAVSTIPKYQTSTHPNSVGSAHQIAMNPQAGHYTGVPEV